MNNEQVSVVTSIRDLGVICDNQLNFRAHYDSIINRANSTLGFVKRWSKEFSNPYVTKSLYVSFVRPLLEYASPAWSPYYHVHIQRIEAVQRRFIRFSLRGLGWDDPFRLPPYESRLKLINLQTLKVRRDNADLLFLHQLLSGGIDCVDLLRKIKQNTNQSRLRSTPLFWIPLHRTEYGQNEPLTRMLRSANNSTIFDLSSSKTALKNALQ